mmetsp:Transcript_46531/g.129444  ORF Transcript_46531/g.129444 Transcript_46531/m.129444 type:complete len:309 (-) Transcript_46531:386-1312(-)
MRHLGSAGLRCNLSFGDLREGPARLHALLPGVAADWKARNPRRFLLGEGDAKWPACEPKDPLVAIQVKEVQRQRAIHQARDLFRVLEIHVQLTRARAVALARAADEQGGAHRQQDEGSGHEDCQNRHPGAQRITVDRLEDVDVVDADGALDSLRVHDLLDLLVEDLTQVTRPQRLLHTAHGAGLLWVHDAQHHDRARWEDSLWEVLARGELYEDVVGRKGIASSLGDGCLEVCLQPLPHRGMCVQLFEVDIGDRRRKVHQILRLQEAALGRQRRPARGLHMRCRVERPCRTRKGSGREALPGLGRWVE